MSVAPMDRVSSARAPRLATNAPAVENISTSPTEATASEVPIRLFEAPRSCRRRNKK